MAAAATLVQHTSLPMPFSSLHPRKRSKPGSYDPLLSPIRSAGLFGQDEAGTVAQPRTFSPSSALEGGLEDYAHPQARQEPAKLRKKQLNKHVAGRRSQDQYRLDETPTESTTPWDSTDSEVQPSRARHNRSISKDKYLKNLQRRFRDKEGDTSTIDLSLTMEENEKRSGLAISSQTQSPESVKDADSQFSRRGHNRSWSANSIAASETNLIGPKMPFMEPIKIESRPHTPLTNRHSFTELEWKLCPGAVDTKAVGLGIAPGPEPRQRAATFDAVGLPGESQAGAFTPSARSSTWNTIASAPTAQKRPKAKSRLSNGSSNLGNASQSTLSSYKQNRSRRSTAQSFDSTAVTSPLARSSTDHTFSFKRGFSSGSKDTPSLNESDRQAAVDAAREEFKQKQAAKSRKYDEQERRANEKRIRREHDHEEKTRRQSDVSGTSRPKSSRRGRESTLQSNTICRNSNEQHPSSAPRWREGFADGVTFDHVPRLTKKNKNPQSTGGSSGFLGWCKSRILHIR